MPEFVTIGPLALPLERLLAIALMWGFLALSLWLVRHEGSARSIPWVALVIGIAVARASFVVVNWETYRSEPAVVAFFWQGGFDPVAGIIAAAISLAFGLRKVRKAGGPLLALAAATALWFGYVHLEAMSPRSPFPQGVRITDLQGRAVSLDDFRGRPFVVNLWASWCGPCRREMPMLTETAAEIRDVPILLINQGEDQRQILGFLRDQSLPGNSVLSDRGASLMRLTGSGGLPTTLFVRADGRIEEAHMGELSRASLLAGIRTLR